MNPPDSVPPVIEPPPLPEQPVPAPVNRRRWAWQLIILVTYVLMIGVMSLGRMGDKSGPMLPPNPISLLQLAFFELTSFFTVFWVTSRISGVTSEQLRLRWHGGLLPLLRGALYSVGLRLLVVVVAAIVAIIYFAVSGTDPKTFKPVAPDVEVLVDPKAMANNQIYLWINLTLMSFVVAGLREELWRAGVLTAMRVLWPRQFGSTFGGVLAVAMIAVVFGFAHAAQGWLGMAVTGVLGFGLGVILVVHRSIWDAVIAHGLFDATSFAMLAYLANHHPEFLRGG